MQNKTQTYNCNTHANTHLYGKTNVCRKNFIFSSLDFFLYFFLLMFGVCAMLLPVIFRFVENLREWRSFERDFKNFNRTKIERRKNEKKKKQQR